jgi:hypothetical protein
VSVKLTSFLNRKNYLEVQLIVIYNIGILFCSILRNTQQEVHILIYSFYVNGQLKGSL